MKPSASTFIIITLILAGGAYWFFFGSGAEQPALSSITTASSTPDQIQFQQLTSNLQNITFNTAIFTDSKFTSLVTIATPIAPETQGRLDIFAQLQK